MMIEILIRLHLMTFYDVNDLELSRTNRCFQIIHTFYLIEFSSIFLLKYFLSEDTFSKREMYR